MCSFSYIFSVLMSTKINCWRSINNFAGSIFFSNEKEDDSSEDDARTAFTARANTFTLLRLLLVPLDVAAPFGDTIKDVFPPERERFLRFNRGAFARATGVASFADGAGFAKARADGFANVNDIVFIIFFFFASSLFSAYTRDEMMTKTRDKNGAFNARSKSSHSSSKEENEETRE